MGTVQKADAITIIKHGGDTDREKIAREFVWM